MPRHAYCILIQNILLESFLFSISQGAILRCFNYKLLFLYLVTPHIVLRGSPTIAMRRTYTKKANERGGCRYSVVNVSPINRAIEWGLRKLVGCLANTVCAHHRASPFMHFARSFGLCTTNAPLPHHNNDMGPVVIPCSSRVQASASPCGAKEALFRFA
jgi:hypothetical protein